MKKFIISAISIVALMTMLSCRFAGEGIQGSGRRQTEKRNVGLFKSIETSGSYEVEVTCQQPMSLEVEGDDNILPLIKTDVVDGVLRIHNDERYHTSKAISVRISMPDLDRFTSSGAGDIHIAKVKNDKLTITSNGAANVEASGETKSADISSAGAGNINTEKLHADRVTVSVTGATNVDVYASQQLDATLSGVGSVTYAGNPPVVNKHISGIGSVSKKE